MAEEVKEETKPENTRFRVRLTHPAERKRTVFSTVSEGRARTYLQNHYPRGTEAYLEHPDGTTESFENERQGENGGDADPWGAFDPETYTPPEETETPAGTDWGDRES